MILSILMQLFVLKTVFSMDGITKDLLTPLTEYGENCGYLSCPISEEGLLNVHIVPSTHGELGYTRTFTQHYTGEDEFYIPSKVNMKNILDSVITSLWAHEHRKFTFTDIPYLFHWWKNRDGTVRRMVYQLLRQGRLFFAGGGWSMTDEATTSYHAIIDHFTYSLRKLNATFLECGRPLVTWQADVYGHSREFASLMAQMGFDGHFINPISYEDELARMKAKNLEFAWRGSDDLGSSSDIYTHKLFDGYWPPPGFCFGSLCDDPLIITSDYSFKNVEERITLFIKQMKDRQSPYYTTKNVMVVMGKRLGYHDSQAWFSNIDKLIMNVNAKQKLYGGKLSTFYSSPACYLRAVNEAAPKLTTKQDDFFPFTYDKDTHASGMYTSRPIIKYLAREVHHYVQIAKQLQILAKLGNNDQLFEEIMWISGVLQDHTIITGGMRPHVSEYYSRKAFIAKEICMRMFRPAFNLLRNAPKDMLYYACRLNISSCWTLEGDQFFIVIYNPLSWPVTMPVRLPVYRGIYTVFDPKGVRQNHSIVTIPDLVVGLPDRGEFITEDELVFIAEKIPPMGYRSYFVDRIQVRTRTKRSIIKKLSKNLKKKTYLTRQTNNLKIDDKSLLDDIPDYEYFDERTENSGSLRADNNSKEREFNYDYSMASLSRSQPPQEYEQTEPNKSVFNMSTTTTTSTPTTTMQVPHRKTFVVPLSNSSTTPYSEYYDDENTDNKVESTTPYFDFEKYYRRMEKSGYHDTLSTDHFIKNEYIQINFNSNGKISNITLSNGVNITFDIQMCYYVSDDPARMGTEKRSPGAWIFRPMDPHPVLITDYIEAKVLKSDIVQELQIKYSPYVEISLRLYKGLPTIEVDWTVGPIPLDDTYGKDVFIRYSTDLDNKAVFYTDSNGRQTIKRIRDVRATYKPVNIDNIAGNIYPVTTKIYIEDVQKNIRLSVFTDRAQGGTCLIDGNVDLMLHRRIFTDDSGIQAYLNETEFGRGLIVRGKHHLYVSKADFRPNKVFEKKFAKELEIGPKVFTSIHPSYINISFESWNTSKNEYTALRMKVPVGVHILTIEKWHDKILLRLENYLEKCDVVRNGLKTVFIKDLFRDFRIIDARETTLSAHIWLNEYTPMHWEKEKFVKNFNDVYGNVSNLEFCNDESDVKPLDNVYIDKGIDLIPQQIRTFVVTYVRV